MVEFVVGQQILVNGKRKGTVRYFGQVKFATGIWVGVELEKATGQHDGEYQGVRYFQCAPGYGTFVPLEHAADITDDDANATRIQSFIKGRKQRVEMQHQMTFKQWNELDMGDEADFLQQNAEFTRINSILQANTPREPRPVQRHFLDTWNEQLQEIAIEDDYSGPKLTWPLTLPQVLSLMESFRRNPGVLLHKKYLWQLVIEVCTMLDKIQGAVLDLQAPKPGKIVVVGDTHGQLNDVLWIFHLYGTPSAEVHYLFNGDIADRGEYAVEIFALLCAFKVLFPDSVHINRGNHESAEMNRRDREAGGGFQKEVRTKYCGQTFNLFQQYFNLMPLASIIGGHTIVVHGGLFRREGVKLSHIRTLNRRQQCPDNPTTYQDTIFFDLLWSDPMPEKGHAQQPARGPGCTRFGPDVTSRFLKSNGLERCVRSHEVPSTLRGFEVHHNARCITIFSASNYCGATGNYGGIMLFDSAEDRPEIKEHWAPSLAEQAKQLAGEAITVPTLQKRDSESQIKMENSVIEKIKQKICERKTDLEWYFVRADPTRTGRVSVSEWCDGLSAVLERDINYARFQKHLVDAEADGQIDYKKFLGRYRLESDKHSGWQQHVLAQVWSMLMQCDYNIRDTIKIFDPSGDGFVSIDEFKALLDSVNTGLSPHQVEMLVDAMYPSGLTNVRVEDFITKFHCFYKTEMKSGESSKIMQKLGPLVRLQGQSLGEAFVRFDTDGNGFVSFDEFAATLKAIAPNVGISDGDLLILAKEIDTDGNGRINYLEFVHAFSEPDSGALQAVDEVVQDIARVLFKHKITLRRACAYFDDGASGRISPVNFKSALEAVNTLLPQPLSAQQLDAIVQFAPRVQDNVEYEAFLDDLEVSAK